MAVSVLNKWLSEPLRQWWDGFRACLPDRVKRGLALEPIPWVMEVQPSGAALVSREFKGRLQEFNLPGATGFKLDADLLSAINKSQAPLTLRVPADWVLIRRTAMPAAARLNLRQVLSFEMDRLTPFSADQVMFDFSVEQENQSDTLAITLALVTVARIQPWMDLLRRNHLPLYSVGAAGLWLGANFLPPELHPKADIKRLAVRFAPVSLLVLMLAISVGLPLWQKKQIESQLSAREMELRKKADAVIRVREQIEAEQKRLDSIINSWQHEPAVLDVIKTLTDLLPDDSSLQQMDMKDGMVTLRGTSKNASTLLKSIEDADGFAEARFMSSVVQQRGEEQFHIAAKIVMPFTQVPMVATAAEDAKPAPSAAPGASASQEQIKPPQPAAESTKGSVPDPKPANAKNAEAKPGGAKAGDGQKASKGNDNAQDKAKGGAKSQPKQAAPNSGPNQRNDRRMISGAG